MAERSPVTDRVRLPVAVGVVAAIAVAVGGFLPVVALDVEWASLRLYVTAGIGGLYVVAGLMIIFALVAAAVFEGRTDAATGLGIALGIALTGAITAVLWAVSVDGNLVAELSPEDWFAMHRWAIAAVALVPAVATAWAANRIDLL